MVADIEAVGLVVFTVLGVLWLRGTPLYRAHRRHGFHTGQHGMNVGFGMYQPSRPTPPPAAMRGLDERRRRKWSLRR
jgi:hypothetical protein